jgi:murein DD-endopeptidase MepM/ murein hydrolase activator NlpD
MKKFAIPLCYLILLAGCSGIRARYHTVVSGDTLASLAKSYDLPLDALREKNALVVAKGLKPGTKVYLPFEDNPLWNDPDGLGRETASEAGAPLAYDLQEAHFSWPVPGPISSYFGTRKRHGRRRQHEGIDIAAGKGTPVRSARSGHVIYADSKLSGYGKMVIVRHADSFTTVYAHLSEFAVKKGQFVSRGQLVGKVGRTGRASGSHLHFEVRTEKKPVDPLLYLEKRIASN